MTHDTQARIEALEMCRAAILSHADGWRDRPAVMMRILAEATRLARRAAKLRGVVAADGKGTVA
ncbi:MAG TPA: hypothetical protein VMV29_09790 [Ktedonobacterales bacterium]|nr:hypothetical protein [Ktedonobacterales bacterium]